MIRVDKLWGFEEIIVNTDLYCFKYLNLKIGHQCSLHYHKIKDETFVVDNGIVEVELSNQFYTLFKGESLRVMPGQTHRFKSLTGTARLIEISTHDDPNDSYRLEQSC